MAAAAIQWSGEVFGRISGFEEPRIFAGRKGCAHHRTGSRVSADPPKHTGPRGKMTSPLVPPFTRETALKKVRAAEDAWNTRDPQRVSLAYSIDSRWRNRSEFVNGRDEIVVFLTRKWARELEYRLIKELWVFDGARIAVRFAYESQDASGQWFRSYGNENWEFDADGLMKRRHASINDLPIQESDRLFHWPLGRRPDDHPGLSDLGL